MGLLDSVTRWFRREAADVKASVDALEDRLDADLTRRERELDADPEERMRMIQEETASDDLLADVQAKIDGVQARADAEEELLPSADDVGAVDDDTRPD